jgi:hypothetical protein
VHRRRLGVAIAAAAAIVSSSLMLATPSSGANESAAKAQHFRTQLRFTFDRSETLAAGTLVHDVSRHHHPGLVRVADGGRLTVGRGVVRHGAHYPAGCATCGKAIIETRDSAALDPGKHQVLFGVTIKATAVQGGGDSNLVQKGFYEEVGGQYKLQMDNGIPSCVVRGALRRLLVVATDSVTDGRWHQLECRRLPKAVILRVDGRTVARKGGRTGFIANAAPVRVGGQSLGHDNDEYHGVLDNVFVSIRS